MPERFRVGGHWAQGPGLVTIIEVGTGPETGEGRRQGDRLMTCASALDAARIVEALNYKFAEESE